MKRTGPGRAVQGVSDAISSPHQESIRNGWRVRCPVCLARTLSRKYSYRDRKHFLWDLYSAPTVRDSGYPQRPWLMTPTHFGCGRGNSGPQYTAVKERRGDACAKTALCIMLSKNVDTTTAEHQDLSHTSSSDMRHKNDRSDDLISERALGNILKKCLQILISASEELGRALFLHSDVIRLQPRANLDRDAAGEWRRRLRHSTAAGRLRGGDGSAAAGHHTPIARGTCDAAPRIIASFIKFSGTKLREFLIENKLRRDSLI
ncbi:unnamed protein product [Spodoptera exigua]|nr:unnamed protein product [Spodoptera exigua]